MTRIISVSPIKKDTQQKIFTKFSIDVLRSYLTKLRNLTKTISLENVRTSAYKCVFTQLCRPGKMVPTLHGPPRGTSGPWVRTFSTSPFSNIYFKLRHTKGGAYRPSLKAFLSITFGSYYCSAGKNPRRPVRKPCRRRSDPYAGREVWDDKRSVDRTTWN